MKLTEEQVQQVIDAAMRGARPPMERALGRSPKAYDHADKIAEGIAYGIREGLKALEEDESAELGARDAYPIIRRDVAREIAAFVQEFADYSDRGLDPNMLHLAAEIESKYGEGA